MAKTYTCCICHQTFETEDADDTAAIAEAEENARLLMAQNPGLDPSDYKIADEVTCDDCFKRMQEFWRERGYVLKGRD